MEYHPLMVAAVHRDNLAKAKEKVRGSPHKVMATWPDVSHVIGVCAEPLNRRRRGGVLKQCPIPVSVTTAHQCQGWPLCPPSWPPKIVGAAAGPAMTGGGGGSCTLARPLLPTPHCCCWHSKAAGWILEASLGQLSCPPCGYWLAP